MKFRRFMRFRRLGEKEGNRRGHMLITWMKNEKENEKRDGCKETRTYNAGNTNKKA